jgi:hypothetical protein
LGKDPAPGRIGQGGESAVKRSRIIFNHLVKYLARRIGHASEIFTATPAFLSPKCECFKTTHSQALAAKTAVNVPSFAPQLSECAQLARRCAGVFASLSAKHFRML